MINDFFNWLREIWDTNTGIAIASILTVLDIYARLKRAKNELKKRPKTAFVSLISLLGVVLPVLILISCPWDSTIHIILNCLAIFALLNFFGLLYIIKEMSQFLKPASESKSKKLSGIR